VAVPISDTDRSLGSVLRELMDGIRELLEKESKLAKREVVTGARRAAKGSALLAAGAIVAIVGLLMSEIAAFEALASIMPRWAAALCVGLPTLAVAGALALVGLAKLRRANPIPEQALEEAARTGSELKGRLQEGMG
jgi:predicted signal transduction protein with EAL and GGDEF domain